MQRVWLEHVQTLAIDLSLDSAEIMAERLISFNRPVPANDSALRHQLEATVHTERRYVQVRNLVTALKDSGVNSAEVGYALLAAAQMNNTYRKRNDISLLWTGPESSIIPVRRNDQGLLDVINSAEDTLYIVTFALYPVKNIQDALRAALDRGVEIHLFIEFPQQDSRLNKTSNNTIDSLGLELALRCHIYEWPMANRPVTTYRDSGGRIRESHATLHAKIAVADDAFLFLSSANLTQHAMSHNVEMGVLIRAGDEPSRVKRHFQALVEDGSFVRKSDEEIVAAASN